MEGDTWRLSNENDIPPEEFKIQEYIAPPTTPYLANTSSTYLDFANSLDLPNQTEPTLNYSCEAMRHLVNVTCELPINYAVPMYGYIMPFLLFITIIANTLIVVVLSKRHMRTPTNVVLMAMALCDMFTLLFPAPWLIYMYTFGNHYKPLWPISICYAWTVMHE
ncbi:hypothetical protein ILUMI_08692, partial [Ignelater luminosus]